MGLVTVKQDGKAKDTNIVPNIQCSEYSIDDALWPHVLVMSSLLTSPMLLY